MKTILITGGTGNIGRKLTALLLKKDYRVIILSRNPDANTSDHHELSYARWNPENFYTDEQAFARADIIINLAGAPIAGKRWTGKQKKRIYDSRINSDITLVKALSELPNRVSAVVNASAIGYYGQGSAGEIFDENSPAGDGFLAKVCHDWEKLAWHIKELERRLVIIRTGIVLDPHSGVYKEFSRPLNFRVGLIPGNGRQVMSWIHIDDLCRIYLHAIETNINGVYNACAPEPVTAADLICAMGRVRFQNAFLKIKIPKIILTAALGEMADEALLQSANVSSSKISAAGFDFQVKNIDAAIQSLAKK